MANRQLEDRPVQIAMGKALISPNNREFHSCEYCSSSYAVGAWSLRNGNGGQIWISLRPPFSDGCRLFRSAG
jgi:hypothetical protein